jgi:hypothetical protein
VRGDHDRDPDHNREIEAEIVETADPPIGVGHHSWRDRPAHRKPGAAIAIRQRDGGVHNAAPSPL